MGPDILAHLEGEVYRRIKGASYHLETALGWLPEGSPWREELQAISDQLLNMIDDLGDITKALERAANLPA